MMQIFSSPWIPAAMVLLLACVARALAKSWLMPGPFALLIWSAGLTLPLLLAPEYRVASIGPWIILLLVACVALGSEVGAGKIVGRPAIGGFLKCPFALLLRTTLLLSLPGLLGGIYWAQKTLSENGLDLSAAGLFALGHIISVDRYTGGQPPGLARALVIWVFPAALLGGISFAAARSVRERILCCSPLVPAMLLSMLQAAKANTLIAVTLGLSGYLSAQVRPGAGISRPINRKMILAVTGSLLAAFSFFFAVDALRSHKQDEEEIRVDADWGRAKSTSLGYLAVFSHWAAGPDGADGFHFQAGAYTVGGLLDIAGLHSRELGIYSDSFDLEGDNSNIYTVFRGLIEDFTLPGAAVLCGVVGFFAGRAYRGALAGCQISSVSLAGFYAFLLWSPVGSVFIYNGPVLAMAVGLLAVRAVARQRKHSLARMNVLESEVQSA